MVAARVSGFENPAVCGSRGQFGLAGNARTIRLLEVVVSWFAAGRLTESGLRTVGRGHEREAHTQHNRYAKARVR